MRNNKKKTNIHNYKIMMMKICPKMNQIYRKNNFSIHNNKILYKMQKIQTK